MPVGISNSRGRAVSPRSVFVVVIVAVFVSNIDLFVVNVALPQIGRDFDGAALNSLSWVLNAYAIIFAAFLVVFGRLADRWGHRPGFLLGLAAFTLGSLLCAVAPGIGWLVAARVVQALGAAVLIPTSLALLLATTPPARRNSAVRAWSAIGGVAAALGPVLGGVLTELDWRWIFLVNLPVGVAALIAARRVLPDVRDANPGPLPDMAAAVLVTLAVGALSLGLVRANDWGWVSARVLGCLAAFVALTVWFVARSARHRAPIVELSLLRVRDFGAATVATLVFAVTFATLILASLLWTQQVWGYSALRAGLALAPGPLMVPLLAVGAGPVAALGSLVISAGLVTLSLSAGTTPSYLTEMLPGTVITGIGVGLALPTLVAAGAATLPAHRFATGSGVLNMARQLGAVLGVAILVSILGAPATPDAAVSAFQHAWFVAAAIGVVAAVAAVRLGRPSATAPAGAEPTDVRRAPSY